MSSHFLDIWLGFLELFLNENTMNFLCLFSLLLVLLVLLLVSDLGSQGYRC